MHAGRADHRAGGMRVAGVHARAQRRHHHVDVAEAHRRPGRSPVARAAACGQRMRGLGAVDDLRQEPPPPGRPSASITVVVVGAGAEVAEGPARLRRVGRAHAGEVEIEPVLAVQRHLGAIEQLRATRSICASCAPCWQVLSPVRSPRTAPAPAARAQPPPRRRPRVEPEPGVAHRRVAAPTSQVPSPCAVTATAAVRRRGPRPSPRARGSPDAVGPGLPSGWLAEPSAPVA